MWNEQFLKNCFSPIRPHVSLFLRTAPLADFPLNPPSPLRQLFPCRGVPDPLPVLIYRGSTMPIFSIYRSIYSCASWVNTCRSRKVRVTPEVQREMLCGKKILPYSNFLFILEGGNRLIRLSSAGLLQLVNIFTHTAVDFGIIHVCLPQGRGVTPKIHGKILCGKEIY